MSLSLVALLGVVGALQSQVALGDSHSPEYNTVLSTPGSYAVVRTKLIATVAKRLSSPSLDLAVQVRSEKAWKATNNRYEDAGPGAKPFPKFYRAEEESYLTAFTFPKGPVNSRAQLDLRDFPGISGSDGGNTVQCAAANLCRSVRALFAEGDLAGIASIEAGVPNYPFHYRIQCLKPEGAPEFCSETLLSAELEFSQ